MNKILFASFGLIGLGCISALPAYAGDLKAPFELDSTATLPKGVRNPRFKNLFMSVDERFGGNAQTEPLGVKLNKVVTFNDIIDAQDTETKKASIMGLMNDAGLASSDSPGSTTGMVRTFADVKVPILAMGITDDWTLAVAVPVYKVEVSVDTGFSRDGDISEKFLKAASAVSPAKEAEAAGKLNDAINQKLVRLGYEPLTNQTISGIGDVKLVNKFRLVNTAEQALSVKAEVTVPSGRAPNADKALDVPTGDGQWDVGAGLSYDRYLLTDLRWNTYGGYTAQLPDHLDRRLPASATDSLSADKEYVSRDLGDQMYVGTSLNYYFPKSGFTVGSGYSIQYQAKTKFNGTQFAEERYRLLENEVPAQLVHAATVMAGFSTVDFFKQKRFALPLQANIAYSRPVRGINVTKNDVLAAELVLFF